MQVCYGHVCQLRRTKEEAGNRSTEAGQCGKSESSLTGCLLVLRVFCSAALRFGLMAMHITDNYGLERVSLSSLLPWPFAI